MYTCVHIYNLHIYIHTHSVMLAIENPSVCSCSWFSDDSPIPAAHLESSGCSHVPANSCQLNTPQMWRWILNLNWGGISFLEGTPFCDKRIILSWKKTIWFAYRGMVNSGREKPLTSWSDWYLPHIGTGQNLLLEQGVSCFTCHLI